MAHPESAAASSKKGKTDGRQTTNQKNMGVVDEAGKKGTGTFLTRGKSFILKTRGKVPRRLRPCLRYEKRGKRAQKRGGSRIRGSSLLSQAQPCQWGGGEEGAG